MIEKDKVTLKTLHKYKPIDSHLYELLCDAELYFAGRSELNDPSEAILRFDKQKAISDEELERNPSTPFRVETIRPSYSAIDNEYFVCMSKKNNDVLLWSHYADNHSGVCLEFDFSQEAIPQMRDGSDQPWKIERRFQGDSDCVWIDSVRYVQDMPGYTLAPNGDLDLSSDEALRNSFIKLSCWKAEEEVRLKLTINEGSKRAKAGKQGQKWRFEPVRLRAVYFGLRVDEKTRNRIMQLARAFSCDFYRAVRIVYENNNHSVIFDPV